MTFNNSSRIVQHNIIQFVALLVYATIMIALIFTTILNFLIVDINKSTIVISISIIYLSFLMYNYIIDYNFVSFSDEGNKFVFHYISTRPLNKKRKAIEIAKNAINNGAENEFISKITGLTIEKIQKLRSETDN